MLNVALDSEVDKMDATTVATQVGLVVAIQPPLLSSTDFNIITMMLYILVMKSRLQKSEQTSKGLCQVLSGVQQPWHLSRRNKVEVIFILPNR